MAAERGGDKTGTGASAFRSTILGKAHDAKQAQAWVDAGLLDPKYVTKDSHGGVTGWKAGGVKDTALALSNPLKWVETVQNPALQKRGVNTDDPMQTTVALGTMYRNQMSNQFAEDLSQKQSRDRLHKDSALMDKTMGIDQSFDYNLKNDPTQAIKTITAAINDLGQAVAGPGMAQIGPVLTGLAGGIKSIAQVAQDHPKLAASAGVTAGAAGLAGSAWFASQMAGGFGLNKSAGLLDGSAAALTRAAGALAAGGGPGIPGEGPGVKPGAAPGKSIWSKAGDLAKRTLPFVAGGLGDLAPVAGGAMWGYGAHADAEQWQKDHPGGWQGLLADNNKQPPLSGYSPGPSPAVSQRDPGWSLNTAPTKSWPMTGAGGATAGAGEAPFSGVPQVMDMSGQAASAGAATAIAYQQALMAQLQATLGGVQSIMQQIVGAMDVSVTPNIGSPSTPAAPQRQSSLTNYDHGRSSGGGGVTIGQ